MYYPLSLFRIRRIAEHGANRDPAFQQQINGVRKRFIIHRMQMPGLFDQIPYVLPEPLLMRLYAPEYLLVIPGLGSDLAELTAPIAVPPLTLDPEIEKRQQLFPGRRH